MLEGESDEKRVEDELEVEAAGQEQEEEEGDFLQSRLVEVAVRCTTDGNALALPPPCLQRLSTEKASQAGPTAYSRGGKPKAGREEGMSIRKKKKKENDERIDRQNRSAKKKSRGSGRSGSSSRISPHAGLQTENSLSSTACLPTRAVNTRKGQEQIELCNVVISLLADFVDLCLSLLWTVLASTITCKEDPLADKTPEEARRGREEKSENIDCLSSMQKSCSFFEGSKGNYRQLAVISAYLSPFLSSD